ncbi:MAG TPA: hypothetical protein VHW23_39195, partial [Kofleriaceae bacterium]|nr:hypothetical protein [Kofleriaceae bacterium]
MTSTRMFAVIAVAAACQDPASSSTAPPPPASPRAAPADAAAPSDAPVQNGPPRVIVMEEPPIVLPHQESLQLLGAGKGARAELRYALAAGTTAVIAHSALRSRHVEHSAFTRPAALPAIRDGFEVSIATPHTGRMSLRPVIGQAAAASPDADAYLAPWRTLLQGRPSTLELDDRGAIAAVRFEDDPSGATSVRARDELVQHLLQLIVPLPAEPVGTGASWRAVTILRQGPAIAKQTAIYTLLARGPARWKLHVKLQRVGQQQAITDPALPPGTSAELVALFRALEGDVEIDPALPMIAGGALTVESRLHARLQPPAQPGQPRPEPIEQMFEDTGKVRFARCRPVAPGAAHPAATRPAATRPAARRPARPAPPAPPALPRARRIRSLTSKMTPLMARKSAASSGLANTLMNVFCRAAPTM